MVKPNDANAATKPPTSFADAIETVLLSTVALPPSSASIADEEQMVRAEGAIAGQLRRCLGMMTDGTDRDTQGGVVRRVGNNCSAGEAVAWITGNGNGVRWSHWSKVRVECQASKAARRSAATSADRHRIAMGRPNTSPTARDLSRLWRDACTGSQRTK